MTFHLIIHYAPSVVQKTSCYREIESATEQLAIAKVEEVLAEFAIEDRPKLASLFNSSGQFVYGHIGPPD